MANVSENKTSGDVLKCLEKKSLKCYLTSIQYCLFQNLFQTKKSEGAAEDSRRCHPCRKKNVNVYVTLYFIKLQKNKIRVESDQRSSDVSLWRSEVGRLFNEYVTKFRSRTSQAAFKCVNFAAV